MTRFNQGLMAVLSVGVALYAWIAYGALPLGALVHPQMRLSFQAHSAAVYAHVFGAAMALAVGPWQFSSRWRARRPGLHRWLGRVYLGVGVLLGGLAGLYLSVHAYGGLPGKLGFAALALLWLFTGVRAFQAIRHGDIQSHRRWMVRNFALSLAAVTLRIWLPSSMMLRIPFDLAYPLIAWLCWVPNLVVAELVLRRSAHGQSRPAPH